MLEIHLKRLRAFVMYARKYRTPVNISEPFWGLPCKCCLPEEPTERRAWGFKKKKKNIKLLGLIRACWPFCTLYELHLENFLQHEGYQDTAMVLGTRQTGSSLHPHHLLWRHSLGAHQDAVMGMTSKLLPWHCLSHAGLYLFFCNLGFLPPHSTDLTGSLLLTHHTVTHNGFWILS